MFIHALITLEVLSVAVELDFFWIMMVSAA